jgi:hypothetical protein
MSECGHCSAVRFGKVGEFRRYRFRRESFDVHLKRARLVAGGTARDQCCRTVKAMEVVERIQHVERSPCIELGRAQAVDLGKRFSEGKA